jgi:hypothetical protein
MVDLNMRLRKKAPGLHHDVLIFLKPRSGVWLNRVSNQLSICLFQPREFILTALDTTLQVGDSKSIDGHS